MSTPGSWNTSALRPSPSAAAMSGVTGADPMRSFDAAAAAACSRSVSDAWSACCQSTTAASAVGAPANAFYPWMAIAGIYQLILSMNINVSMDALFIFK